MEKINGGTEVEEHDLRTIAESYLDEMLEAERTRDFKAWTNRFNDDDLEGFSEEIFLSDLDRMEKNLGVYKSREFFGIVKGPKNISAKDSLSPSFRFVWKAIFEKNEALIIVGIRQIDGIWCPCSNVCSI
ncbi:MAG: hypothetical protein AAF228_04840 [Pseudomonadota bacterium]